MLDLKWELWNRGNLTWKLDPNQLEIYHAIHNRKGKVFGVNCSRRIGKTYLAGVISAEICIKKKNARVRFGAPTGEDLEEIILPIFSEIFSDCPPWLEPEYKTQKKKFVFKNGAEIKLSGVDKGNHTKLRGPRADLCVAEEGGFMECLKTLIHDIFMPQLMYSDTGFILLNSTPSDSPGHFYTEYCQKLELIGSYIEKTIWDNPRLGLEEMLEFAEEANCEVNWDLFRDLVRNGLDPFNLDERRKHASELITEVTTTWRREYLAEHVIEETRAVIPEFTKERQELIIKEWPKPEVYHPIVVGDTGFKDATVFAFGYYDFINAKVVIEDELVLYSPNSQEIAENALRIEQLRFSDTDNHPIRFGDGDLIVLNDLTVLHGFHINPVRKDALEAQVNCLRQDVKAQNLVIHPRCKTIINHIKFGIWDKPRKKFDRSSEHFHFDGLAAAIYFVRHVDRNTNPYPPDYKKHWSKHYIPESIYKKEHALEKLAWPK